MTNTWDGGKSDDGEILEAIRVLVDMGYPRDKIVKEPFVGGRPNDDCPSYTVDPGANPGDGYAWIHHPDIAVYRPGGAALAFLVEIDGSWHDTVQGCKQTARRDRDYADLKIPCIAIRLSEFPGEGNWQAYLRRRATEGLALHG